MIEGRPICITVPWDWEKQPLDAGFNETILTEDLMDEDFPAGKIVEACNADWLVKVEDTFPGKYQLVKCMEPASWWFAVANAPICGSYCDYHKPKVRPL